MHNQVKLIDVHELKKRYSENNLLLLIDVRELSEWNEVHIPWTQHIPKDKINETIHSICPDINTPIYLHCRSGTRSQYAGQALIEQGYQVVYSVTGGIIDWVKSGYEHIAS